MNLKEGRERTVLRMVAQGMRSKDIASRLCVAEITVRKIFLFRLIIFYDIIFLWLH